MTKTENVLLIAVCLIFAGCGKTKKESSSPEVAKGCQDALQCEKLSEDIVTVTEQRTVAIKNGNVPDAWTASLILSSTENLKIRAEAAILTAEDFEWSKNDIKAKLSMTSKFSDTSAEAKWCLNDTCRYFNEIKRLKLIFSDVEAGDDQLQLLEVNLELNYRYLLAAKESEGSTDPSINDRYITVRSLVSQLKADFGRNASGIQWMQECPKATEVECENLNARLTLLRHQYESAIQSKNEYSANLILSEIHLTVALLEMARDGHASSSPEADAVNRRYKLMLAILGRGPVEPGTVPAGEIRKAYTEGERGEVERVFKKINPLYIGLSATNADGKPQFDEVKSKQHLPWSGYWYPMRDDRFYKLDSSPLAKLDAVASARGRQSNARNIQKSKHEALAISWSLWDGHCDAWANASLMTPEPKSAVSKDGQTFLVSDIKALLVLKYAGFPLDFYGKIYRGSPDTDGEIQDIRPEAFHRLVEHFIGEKGLSIGIDDDPEPAIWNKPMYSMRWLVKADPENKNAYLVDAYPMLINTRQEPSEEPTDPNAFDRNDVKRPKLEYRLFYDPADSLNGKHRVIYGEWINRSLTNHPDTVFVPQSDGIPAPRNADVTKNLDLIDELLKDSLR